MLCKHCPIYYSVKLYPIISKIKNKHTITKKKSELVHGKIQLRHEVNLGRFTKMLSG